MCDTCHAGCCRAYNLIITVHDALVIARDLSIPVSEFISMLPRDAETKKKMGDLHTPLRFSDPGFEDSYFYITLKRVESRLIPGSVKCYFLHEWPRVEPIPARGTHLGAKVIGRCGIYGSRPLMCRVYPTFLHESGALGFVTNPQPMDVAKLNQAYELCPEKWTASGFAPNVDQALHSLVLNRYEIDFQNQLIKEWNLNPRPLKDFFPFAAACYTNRLRVAPELVQAPPSTEAESKAPPASANL